MIMKVTTDSDAMSVTSHLCSCLLSWCFGCFFDESTEQTTFLLMGENAKWKVNVLISNTYYV